MCEHTHEIFFAVGEDFTGDPITVTFESGDSVAEADVPITNDNVVEDTEEFTAVLTTSADNARIGEDTATVIILDNAGEEVPVIIGTAVYILIVKLAGSLTALIHNISRALFSPPLVPEPQFELTMYTVPENDRTVPLCIDVGVVLSEPMEFVITSKAKDPPEAQGLFS